MRTNVGFLGERAREIVDQEVDRSRGLDAKAAGLIAVSLAGLAGGIGLLTKVPDLHGGSGAHVLWSVLLTAGLVLFVPAIGFAVWTILPQAFRIAVHVDELKTWVTPRGLDRDPTDVEGELLYGSVIAVEDARRIAKAKADRLTCAFWAFAAAMLAILACGVSIGVHVAEYASTNAAGAQQQARSAQQSARCRTSASSIRATRKRACSRP